MAAKKAKKTPAKSKAKRTTPKTAKAKAAPKRATASKAPAKAGGKAAPKAKGKAAPKRSAKAPARKAKRPALKPKRAPKAAATAPKAPAPPKATVTNPEAHALAQRIAGVALEKKATDVLIIDAASRSSAVGYDYLVVATGESDRQLSAIAEGVAEVLKPQGTRALGVEQSPDWVAMDYAQVVAHFFSPERRANTDLEGLWASAPRVKVQPTAG